MSNTIIIGNVGTGKTEFLKNKIIPDLLKNDKKILFVDFGKNDLSLRDNFKSQCEEHGALDEFVSVEYGKDDLLSSMNRDFIYLTFGPLEGSGKTITHRIEAVVELYNLMKELQEFTLVFDEVNSLEKTDSLFANLIRKHGSVIVLSQTGELLNQGLNFETQYLFRTNSIEEARDLDDFEVIKKTNDKKIIKLDEFSLEQSLTKHSKQGMILVVKSFDMPHNALNKEVLLKGRVLVATSIMDHSESIEQTLCELGLVDEFNKSKSDSIIDLATELLAHNGGLEIK